MINDPESILLDCMAGTEVLLTFTTKEEASAFRKRLYRARGRANEIWASIPHTHQYPGSTHDIRIILKDNTLKLVRPYAIKTVRIAD